MKKVLPPSIHVTLTGTARGRGVFAGKVFLPGELVEVSPVVLVDCKHFDLPVEITHYAFSWRGLTGGESLQALALGYGSLYNHANPANMVYRGDVENNAIVFLAARRIEAGEELTINYSAPGGGAACEGERWFAQHDVQPCPDTPADS